MLFQRIRCFKERSTLGYLNHQSRDFTNETSTLDSFVQSANLSVRRFARKWASEVQKYGHSSFLSAIINKRQRLIEVGVCYLHFLLKHGICQTDDCYTLSVKETRHCVPLNLPAYYIPSFSLCKDHKFQWRSLQLSAYFREISALICLSWRKLKDFVLLPLDLYLIRFAMANT